MKIQIVSYLINSMQFARFSLQYLLVKSFLPFECWKQALISTIKFATENLAESPLSKQNKKKKKKKKENLIRLKAMPHLLTLVNLEAPAGRVVNDPAFGSRARVPLGKRDFIRI